MKKMIKIELERAFKSSGIWITLAIGLIICSVEIIRVVLPMANSPLKFFRVDNATVLPASAYQYWIGGGFIYENVLMTRLFPILAAMPYGVTYLSDIKSGIVKGYYTRVNKINYLVAKYIAVFVTGGLAVTIPYLLNFLVTLALLPSIVWPIGVFPVYGSAMWSGLFYQHPFLYVIAFLCLFFVCGGLMSTMVLVFSNLIGNRFIAVIAPYIVCEFANSMLKLSRVDWIIGMAPYRLFNIVQNVAHCGISYICYIALMIILGFIIYFIGGLKDETY